MRRRQCTNKAAPIAILRSSPFAATIKLAPPPPAISRLTPTPSSGVISHYLHVAGTTEADRFTPAAQQRFFAPIVTRYGQVGWSGGRRFRLALVWPTEPRRLSSRPRYRTTRGEFRRRRGLFPPSGVYEKLNTEGEPMHFFCLEVAGAPSGGSRQFARHGMDAVHN